jgi:multiple sugar transport system ATP-binding protein
MFGVRPEHVRLTPPSDDSLRGSVKHVEYFGSHWIAELETPAGVLKAVVDKAQRPREGDAVGVAFETGRIVLFDADTERLLPSATTVKHRSRMFHG